MATREDMHDAAYEAWAALHSDGGDHYPCKLCGAVMYACMDYTHKPSCPTLSIERAIDDYFESLEWDGGKRREAASAAAR